MTSFSFHSRLSVSCMPELAPRAPNGDTWWAADVLEVEMGNGRMLLSTLDLINHLDADPVAELILFNMINYMN